MLLSNSRGSRGIADSGSADAAGEQSHTARAAAGLFLNATAAAPAMPTRQLGAYDAGLANSTAITSRSARSRPVAQQCDRQFRRIEDQFEAALRAIVVEAERIGLTTDPSGVPQLRVFIERLVLV